ncbi:unnamed protein product [Cylicostephanus goldi]|uniref:Uncharacterized protein n=1 Tax=Cylicostephanus goldi TaxID=71465 RepID=A0A3P6RIE8_CYLGO|nr:unnamed protein product [Cylicostephanus goldi]
MLVLKDCYDRQRSSMPNTARPPPSLKTDTSDNTFHASLSMLENATQNSAAAYTASWVSSTSSIPPELRDEPEVPSFNGSAHDGFRDEPPIGPSANLAPPVGSFTDQFSKMSVQDKHWPGLGKDGDNTSGGGSARRRRLEERERRTRASPRELTWEERIRKGAVQKERVEQRGSEKSERENRESSSVSGRGAHKSQRGGRLPESGKIENGGRDAEISPVLGVGPNEISRAFSFCLFFPNL